MEGSSFSPQMNRGLSACPASVLVYHSPPPPPVFNGLHCLTLSAHPDLFVHLKKQDNVSGVLWDQESISYHFLLILLWMQSFSYVAHLLEPCDCCSVLSDGWVSGPVAEHPLQHHPHSVCLLSQWGWRHFPDIALLAQRLQWTVCGWRYIELGKEGDRKMRQGDREGEPGRQG